MLRHFIEALAEYATFVTLLCGAARQMLRVNSLFVVHPLQIATFYAIEPAREFWDKAGNVVGV